MTTLEKVLQLKKEGIPDAEIVKKLKNEGTPPMEISDAMNQSKIKEAVSGEKENSTKGMTPSIMGNESEEENNSSNKEDLYTPSPAPQENEDYSNYSSQENYSSNENYSSDENYPSDEYYSQDYSPGSSQGGYSMSPETMIEVAEQVFSEKMKSFENSVRNLKEFKAISSPQIKDLDERLRRIEKQFDKMQIAILERVGEFGRKVDSVKKEIEMVEDSFEKLNRKRK